MYVNTRDMFSHHNEFIQCKRTYFFHYSDCELLPMNDKECNHRPTEHGGHTDMWVCSEDNQIWQLRWVPVESVTEVVEYTKENSNER